jgi:DNA-binding CsgD family transcriptional regulator
MNRAAARLRTHGAGLKPAKVSVAPNNPPSDDHRPVSCEWLFDAFNHLGSGAILIGAGGQPLFANAAARQHCNSALAATETQLFATDPASNVALQALIQAMKKMPNAQPSRHRIALARPGEPPLVAYTIPANRVVTEFRGAVGILVIVDPQKRELTASLLQQLFELTSAEARLASGLVKGLDLHEIAEQHGVSVETLRVQLKSIFAKTHTKRQPQLVAMLAQLSI